MTDKSVASDDDVFHLGAPLFLLSSGWRISGSAARHGYGSNTVEGYVRDAREPYIFLDHEEGVHGGRGIGQADHANRERTDAYHTPIEDHLGATLASTVNKFMDATFAMVIVPPLLLFLLGTISPRLHN